MVVYYIDYDNLPPACCFFRLDKSGLDYLHNIRPLLAFSKEIGMKFFTRSVAQFRPTVAGSRFFNANCVGGAMESFLEGVLEGSLNATPTIPSKSRSVVIKPYRTMEGPECDSMFIPLVGAAEESVKVSVDHRTVFIEARLDMELDDKFIEDSQKYICSIDLPDKLYKISDIKAHMVRNSGELQLSIPKLKQDELEVLKFNVKVNVTDSE